MPELVGVRRNLWMTRAPGGFRRMNFPIDGLVLYLPLWHPELSGSPFLSKDLNAHSCTVYGTTWGLQGRSFDGTDDYITIPWTDTSILTEATIELWISRASWALPASEEAITQIGDIYDVATNAMYLSFHKAVGVHFRRGNGNYLSYNAASEAPGFHKIDIVVTATTGTLYFDAVSKDFKSISSCGAVNNPLYIGIRESLAYDFTGLIGEFRISNRAFSLTELLHNYQATKWRYQ